MTAEKQRNAIAEACGWAPAGWRPVHSTNKATDLCLGGTEDWWRNANENTVARFAELPDYLNDLNAMHEAEQLLHAGQLVDYVKHLATRHPTFCVDVIDDRDPEGDWHYEMGFLITATAALRAEAFLRTLNLWEDA